MKNLDKNGLQYFWSKIKNRFITTVQYQKDNQYRAHVIIPQHEATSDEYYLLATLLPNASSNGGQIHVNANVGGFSSFTKATIDFNLTSRSYNYNTDFTLKDDLKGFYYGKIKAFEYADFYITKLDDGYFNLYLVIKAGNWVCPIQMNYEFYYRGGTYLHDIIYQPTIDNKLAAYEGTLVGVASEVLINYENRINEIEQRRTSVPVGGSIVWYGDEASIPSDWMREDGRSLNKNDYPALFAIIGYTFGGEGDTFNLPDSRGTTPVHLNESDTEFNAVGKKYGTKTHTLTTSQMPKHEHELPFYSSNWPETVPNKTNTIAFGGYTNTGVRYANTNKNNDEGTLQGGSQPHNNIQPSFTGYRIIKVTEDVACKDLRDLDAKVKELETIVNKLNTNLGDLEVEIIDEW